MAWPRPQQALGGGGGGCRTALTAPGRRPVEVCRAGSAGQSRAAGRNAQVRRAVLTLSGAGAGVHVTYRLGRRGARSVKSCLCSRSRPGE